MTKQASYTSTIELFSFVYANCQFHIRPRDIPLVIFLLTISLHVWVSCVTYLSIAKATIVYIDVDNVTVFRKGTALHMASPNGQFWLIFKASRPGTVNTINMISVIARLRRKALGTVRMSGFFTMTRHTNPFPGNKMDFVIIYGILVVQL